MWISKREGRENMKSQPGTFIVKIIEQQNDSWQGTVTYVEKNETQHFRSAMELLHLMDEVMQTKQKRI